MLAFSEFKPSFLCLRRGVSIPGAIWLAIRSFSLPTQRCFRAFSRNFTPFHLFSAYAEVFLADDTDSSDLQNFSLPTQRCFSVDGASVSFDTLFSAYAEVFPECNRSVTTAPTFLCLRRGVSPPLAPRPRSAHFSLPTQRCFSLWGTMRPHAMLFSAYAEVFPAGLRGTDASFSFLCLRRGVSWSPDVNGREVLSRAIKFDQVNEPTPKPRSFTILRIAVSEQTLAA